MEVCGSGYYGSIQYFLRCKFYFATQLYFGRAFCFAGRLLPVFRIAELQTSQKSQKEIKEDTMSWRVYFFAVLALVNLVAAIRHLILHHYPMSLLNAFVFGLCLLVAWMNYKMRK